MFDELIARLEQATGPDRQIEIEVFRAVPGLVNERHCEQWRKRDRRTDLTREMYTDAWAPSFTTSLDAAMALVPDGFTATCARTNIEDEMEYAASVNWEPVVTGATMAIALCTAALKARTAMQMGRAIEEAESVASPHLPKAPGDG